MADPQQQRQVPFLAPVIANLMTPVAEAVAESARRTMALPAAEIIEVCCPSCDRVIALWARLTGCLYETGRDATLGTPLSADRRERVRVRCAACLKSWHTSGRAVGRHLHNGRPPLA
jgi:hypothetical protein